MSKILLREKAVALRLQGQTYGQIRKVVEVSKSTLSDWLRKLPLTEKQLQILSQNRERVLELGREKFRNACQNKKLNRLKEIYQEQFKKLLPFSNKELFLSGLFLYWGEGEKKHGRISISNTDPRVAKFALYWMLKSLKIPKEKVRIGLHLYKDMDINEAINFWSKTLNISRKQFNKPYIKKTNREGLTYKSFGHGTCKLYAGSVLLSEKVAMSIKCISDKYGARDEIFWYN